MEQRDLDITSGMRAFKLGRFGKGSWQTRLSKLAKLKPNANNRTLVGSTPVYHGLYSASIPKVSGFKSYTRIPLRLENGSKVHYWETTITTFPLAHRIGFPNTRPYRDPLSSIQGMLQEIMGWSYFDNIGPSRGRVLLPGSALYWSDKDVRSILTAPNRVLRDLPNSAYSEGLKLLMIPLKENSMPHMASRTLGLAQLEPGRSKSADEKELDSVVVLACWPERS
ncbi:hypothetical protein F4779DRAFT_118527 [Xylariaceae sp. FL0662B]|nr:hypothetical protein F4779DRAFT_118527 [Xylariaceae sp. FL0662B]